MRNKDEIFQRSKEDTTGSSQLTVRTCISCSSRLVQTLSIYIYIYFIDCSNLQSVQNITEQVQSTKVRHLNEHTRKKG